MGKSTPSAPAAPDPAATAAAQTQSNVQTAIANAELNDVNQSTPYGTSTWTNNGTNPDGTPIMSQAVTLSAPEQQLFNTTTGNQNTLANMATGQLGQIKSTTANGFNPTGLSQITGNVNAPTLQTSIAPTSGGIQYGIANAGNIQTGVNGAGQGIDYNGASASMGNPAVAQAEMATYGAAEPMLQTQQDALNNNLVNEGVQQGTQAWNNAQMPMEQQQNQLIDQSVLAGQGEQNTLFGQAATNAGLVNSAQGQGFGEGLSAANFANSAQQQQFTENAAQQAAQNAAQQQNYSQNANDATFGNEALGQQFGFGLSNAGLSNSANQQGYNEALTNYNLPLNEYTAMASGSQVQQPNFSATPSIGVQGTPYGQYAYQSYQGAQDAYNQQVASQNASTSGMYGLAGLGLMALA